MKKPIIIGIIAVIAIILITNIVDFSAEAIKPQPSASDNELTALEVKISDFEADIICSGGGVIDKRFDEIIYRKGFGGFSVQEFGVGQLFSATALKGTLSGETFELLGTLSADNSGCSTSYLPTTFILSGACGENSLVTFETDSGISTSYTTNVACI